MSYRDGRRGGRGRREASSLRSNRPRRGPGPTGSLPGGKAPIGSLYIREDGRSKFYPEGGRDKPYLHDRPSRDPSPGGGGAYPREPWSSDTKRPLGVQPVFYNNSFGETSPDFVMPGMPSPLPFKADDDIDYDDDEIDDDVRRKFDAPVPSPQQAPLRSCIIFGSLAFIVLVVIAMAIIFPIAFIGSTATGPSVTGTVQLNRTFVDAYNDATSTEYTVLTAEFISVMNRVFTDSSTYRDDFTETRVTDLEAGDSTASTQVSFTLIFNFGTNVTTAFRNDIMEFLNGEINMGTFASLDVLSGTLTINET